MATAISDAYFATYLALSDIPVVSMLSRVSTVAEDRGTRSYVPSVGWAKTLAFGHTVRGSTAEPEKVALDVGIRNAGDAVLEHLYDFVGLDSGWDGAEAAAPVFPAIRQAARFVRSVRSSDIDIEPTLDVDGSVVLELENGSLKFKGDGKVIYAFDDGAHGIVAFDGVTLPLAVSQAMIA